MPDADTGHSCTTSKVTAVFTSKHMFMATHCFYIVCALSALYDQLRYNALLLHSIMHYMAHVYTYPCMS